MSGKTYAILAEWDDEARVRVATSEDVPGLVAEAETMERLAAKLRGLIPELLELNSALLREGRGPERL